MIAVVEKDLAVLDDIRPTNYWAKVGIRPCFLRIARHNPRKASEIFGRLKQETTSALSGTSTLVLSGPRAQFMKVSAQALLPLTSGEKMMAAGT